MGEHRGREIFLARRKEEEGFIYSTETEKRKDQTVGERLWEIFTKRLTNVLY